MKMQNYLKESEYVDFSNPKIKSLAESLSSIAKNDEDVVRKCFEYVRDNIRHTGDYKDNITTLKASEVLIKGTGWCYAKSILLAALLRANKIPTAFCYQRLKCDEYIEDKYCLHGLNAVFLKDYGWDRIDARGNKKGVKAQFNPPYEQLAFELQKDEFEINELYEEPLVEVVEALIKYKTYDEMINNFPDI